MLPSLEVSNMAEGVAGLLINCCSIDDRGVSFGAVSLGELTEVGLLPLGEPTEVGREPAVFGRDAVDDFAVPGRLKKAASITRDAATPARTSHQLMR